MLTPINNPENSLKYYLRKKWVKAIIAIVVIIALVVLVLFFNNERKNEGNSPSKVISNLPFGHPQRQLAEKRDRPSFGNKNSRLVIVEFSDFQCPVCQAEFPIIREIISQYQDQIFFIYRQYPIINEGSVMVSQASLCAQEQDKFWLMHDRLFLNPRDDFSLDDLKNIAQQSGLNMKQFNDCLAQEKYKDMVMEDLQDAYALQSPGTPTFFINGDRLSGKISKEDWEIIINQSLKMLNNQN